MNIGVLKEIKNNEYRVSLTPASVHELILQGHAVFVEIQAGFGSGFSNDDYQKIGAKIVSKSIVFDKCELILKVKEPLEEEYHFFKPQHILFTYLHLAASRSLTDVLLKSGATCIAYESISDNNGKLPLLVPMSQIAGRLSVQEGVRFLLKSNGGSGVLIGGVPGVLPGKVVIIGGGVVGTEAAKMASGLNAYVTILDVNHARINDLDELLPLNVTTLYASKENIEKEVINADLVIGAVLIPGGKAPNLVSEALIKKMKKGSVVIDVAVDQGGCIETSEVTTHEHPIVEKHGILHYGVANMPGSVPRTATQALVNSTFPFVKKIANLGFLRAIKQDELLAKGVNIYKYQLFSAAVGRTFNMAVEDLNSLIQEIG
jgi:alanine dehydrogenase